MVRFVPLLCVLTAIVSALFLPAPGIAQTAGPLAGVWSLDRTLSELPREMAFTPDWLARSGGDGQSAAPTTSGRGGRGSARGSSGSAGSVPFSRESYEDAQRVRALSDEARNPPARLTIVDTPSVVTIANDDKPARTLHPNGKEESIEIDGVPVVTTTRRNGDRLVVVYRAGQDREVRYEFSRSITSQQQLIVEVQLLQRGAGAKVRRVYEVAPSSSTSTAPATSAPSTGGAATGTAPATTSSGQQTDEAADQRPGAEFKGLKNLGILVEELSGQAIGCGLSRDTIESALSKRLRDAGFAVRTNSDEDTYLYVNIMTTAGSNGTCVSRYDAFLYTHATARLSYRDRPALVQVSLAHRGGIGSSAPTGHAAAVVRALEAYVDVFIGEIHDANK